MRNWVVLFSSATASGVYPGRTDARPSAIKKAAAADKLAYYEVDLKGVDNRDKLLEKLAQALGFPAYFGKNWDALNDCLTDLAWHPASGYVILLKKFAYFAETCPAETATAGEIFETAAQYWKHKGVPFYIILD
jgi:RNAse (barnase) inhibitor barstar